MKRAGTSLMEMLVVIALLGAVMVMGGQIVSALFRFQQQLHSDFDQRRTVQRLATQWRKDAHAAREAQLVKDSQIDFTLTDGKEVEYVVDGWQIHRHVRKGDIVAHRETFRLPRRSVIRLEIETLTESGRHLARIAIGASGASPRSEPAPLSAVIDAAVGINQEVSR